MKVVAFNSRIEVERNRSAKEHREALRALAGNLLRIVRGSGKPSNIYDQINRYVQAANDFQDAHGHCADDDQIRPALEVVNMETGEDKIIRGALLAAGSRLTKREKA